MATSTTGPTGPMAPGAAGGVGAAMDDPPSGQGSQPGNQPTATAGPRGVAALRQRRQGSGSGRRARLEVSRFDTITVLKFSALWSVAVVIVMLVAATVLYWVLSSVGFISGIEEALVDVTANAEGSSPLEGVFSMWTVLSFTFVASIVLAVCMTGILTLTSVLYNSVVDIIGGIGVTLTDRG